MSDMCTDDMMQELLDVMAAANGKELSRLDALLMDYPDDPRLHFMKGSYLVGKGRHIDAYASLVRAIEIAPDFAIARFQLGFFQLTSGEADAALETLKPLCAIEGEHYLKCFAEGLGNLSRDEFGDCIENLNAGMEINTENKPLNTDMRMIVDRCVSLNNQEDVAQIENETEASTTSILLGQFSGDETKH